MKRMKRRRQEKIKFIVFDYGGVIAPEALSHRFSEKLSKKTGVDEKIILTIFKKNLKRFELGKVSCENFWRNFSKTTGIEQVVARNVLFSIVRPKKQMLKLVWKLKKEYKTVLLSNNIRDVSRRLVKKHQMKRYFNMLFFSCYIGKIKPEKHIYKYMLKKLNASPNEVVFIDDKKKNIIGARAVGINGIVFKNAVQLKRDLKRHGVKI